MTYLFNSESKGPFWAQLDAPMSNNISIKSGDVYINDIQLQLSASEPPISVRDLIERIEYLESKVAELEAKPDFNW